MHARIYIKKHPKVNTSECFVTLIYFDTIKYQEYFINLLYWQMIRKARTKELNYLSFLQASRFIYIRIKE